MQKQDEGSKVNGEDVLEQGGDQPKLVVTWPGPGMAGFMMSRHNVEPMQLMALAGYLSIVAEVEVVAMHQQMMANAASKQIVRPSIVVPSGLRKR